MLKLSLFAFNKSLSFEAPNFNIVDQFRGEAVLERKWVLRKKIQFLSIQGRLEDADKIFKELKASHAISILPLSKDREALQDYFRQQQALISTGRVQLGEEIQAEVDAKCGKITDDSFPYYWHLFHLTSAYVEAGYPQYAEKYWKIILNKYEPHFQEIKKMKNRSEDQKRIFSLCANSFNELGLLYYNQGNIDLWKEYSVKITGCHLMTASKYFETKRCMFLDVAPDIMMTEPNITMPTAVLFLKIHGYPVSFDNCSITAQVRTCSDEIVDSNCKHDISPEKRSHASVQTFVSREILLKHNELLFFVIVKTEHGEEMHIQAFTTIKVLQ